MRTRLFTPGHLASALALGVLALLSTQASAQIAAGKDKFAGNVIGQSIPSNFANYWNQVTPENAGKWASVEPNRDPMSWATLDSFYNFAQQRGFKVKGYTLVSTVSASRRMTSSPLHDSRNAFVNERQGSLICS